MQFRPGEKCFTIKKSKIVARLERHLKVKTKNPFLPVTFFFEGHENMKQVLTHLGHHNLHLTAMTFDPRETGGDLYTPIGNYYINITLISFFVFF